MTAEEVVRQAEAERLPLLKADNILDKGVSFDMTGNMPRVGRGSRPRRAKTTSPKVFLG